MSREFHHELQEKYVSLDFLGGVGVKITRSNGLGDRENPFDATKQGKPPTRRSCEGTFSFTKAMFSFTHR